MIAPQHRVPRITYRDLALIFRLLALACIALELERQRGTDHAA